MSPRSARPNTRISRSASAFWSGSRYSPLIALEIRLCWSGEMAAPVRESRMVPCVAWEYAVK